MPRFDLGHDFSVEPDLLDTAPVEDDERLAFVPPSPGEIGIDGRWRKNEAVEFLGLGELWLWLWILWRIGIVTNVRGLYKDPRRCP